jgi:hypothetical protein
MTRIALVSACLAALAWTAQAPGHTLCTPGVKTVSGVTYRTFCGPAHATIKSGGKTYTLRNGSCDSTKGLFTINVGTITLGLGVPKYAYFGITIATAKDGTFTTGTAVAWQLPGKRRSLWHTTVKLQGGRTHGTFTGTFIIGGGTASGTFACR